MLLIPGYKRGAVVSALEEDAADSGNSRHRCLYPPRIVDAERMQLTTFPNRETRIKPGVGPQCHGFMPSGLDLEWPYER